MARNHQVTVICSHFGAEVVKRFGYDLPVIVTEAHSPRSKAKFSRLAYLYRLYAALKATWRCRHYELVYAGSCYFFDLVPALLLAAKSSARRCVASCFHLIPPPVQRDGAWAVNALAYAEQRVMLLLLRLYRVRVIVDNKALLEALVKMGFKRERLYLSSMGVAHKNIIGEGAAANDSVNSVIYVGRRSAQKGVDRLLRAWRTVASEESGVNLVLIGRDGPGFDTDGKVQALGLNGRVSIFSDLDDAGVSRALAAGRFFVTASLEEGFGVSVLEALAHGLPCVTFDLPAFREAFPVGRHVVKEATDEALARAIVSLLRNPGMVGALRSEIAGKFSFESWDQVGEGVISWIESV